MSAETELAVLKNQIDDLIYRSKLLEGKVEKQQTDLDKLSGAKNLGIFLVAIVTAIGGLSGYIFGQK